MTDDILFEQRGRIGLVTLNRPKALNALNRDMCVALHHQLDAWAADDSVEAVVVTAEGDRAFCAGGDVVGLYNAGKSGSADWENFFFDEYRMNHRIGNYPKPYVALVDGIVMGGGVGISIHAPYRVATERTLFAMPETGIGMLPDVGGTHALPRMPGELGTFLGLTGTRMKAADCVYSGYASHYVPSELIPALIDRLASGGEDVVTILDEMHQDPGEAPLEKVRDAIDYHFAHDAVDAIVDSLAAGDDWAQGMAATLRGMSPVSCKFTLRALRMGTDDDLAQCLITEYRIVCAIKRGQDFFEGIRAQLIDKDRNPKWSPATLAEVTSEMVDDYFVTPAGGDLHFN